MVVNKLLVLPIVSLALFPALVHTHSFHNVVANMSNLELQKTNDTICGFFWQWKWMFITTIMHPKWLPFIPEETKLKWAIQEQYMLQQMIQNSLEKCPNKVANESTKLQLMLQEKQQEIHHYEYKLRMKYHNQLQQVEQLQQQIMNRLRVMARHTPK